MARAFSPGAGVLQGDGTMSQRESGCSSLQSLPFCLLWSHTGTHTSPWPQATCPQRQEPAAGWDGRRPVRFISTETNAVLTLLSAEHCNLF